MNYRSIISLVFVVTIIEFLSEVETETWNLSKDTCGERIKSINSISKFLSFATKLVEKFPDEKQALLINDCMHSIDGLDDTKALLKIVRQLSEIHSICEPDYIDQLLSFDTQLKSNARRGIFKIKQRHRLSPFFRLLASQVFLTCKKSLADKFKEAEESDLEVVESLNLISELINSDHNNRPLAKEKIEKLSPVLRIIVDLTTKYAPMLTSTIDGLVLLESLKPRPNIEFSFNVTLNNQEMLQRYIRTKRACKRIDRYAQSSVYSTAKLSWRGYMARNNAMLMRDKYKEIRSYLSSHSRIEKWIETIQFCQGVLLVKANLDVDQETPVKIDKEYGSDEKFINIDFQVQTHDSSNDLADHRNQLDEIDVTQNKDNARWYRYKHSDKIIEIDDDIFCYINADGVQRSLMDRLGEGERMLAKHLRISTLDKQLKQYLFNYNEDPEKEVKNVVCGVAMLVFFASTTLKTLLDSIHS